MILWSMTNQIRLEIFLVVIQFSFFSFPTNKKLSKKQIGWIQTLKNLLQREIKGEKVWQVIVFIYKSFNQTQKRRQYKTIIIYNVLYQYNFPTHIQENLIIDIMSIFIFASDNFLIVKEIQRNIWNTKAIYTSCRFTSKYCENATSNNLSRLYFSRI